MNLKLSEWASIADIMSAMAVVITLIVLIAGIRDNTEVVRASMYSDLADQINEGSRMLVVNDQLFGLYLAGITGRTDNLNPAQKERLFLAIQQALQIVDTAYTMFSYGLLSENEWSRFQGDLCFGYDIALKLRGDRAKRQYSDRFGEYLEAAC
jgi:hypothetical protein